MAFHAPAVCHAEINALLNRNVKSVERCTLYCNFSPCWDCAREMLQVGIKKVVYGNTYDTEALKRIKKVTGTDGRCVDVYKLWVLFVSAFLQTARNEIVN